MTPGSSAYNGMLNDCWPELSHKFVCQQGPQTVQPTQPKLPTVELQTNMCYLFYNIVFWNGGLKKEFSLWENISIHCQDINCPSFILSLLTLCGREMKKIRHISELFF